MSIINVSNLVKRYGNYIALDHFNLKVEEGEIFGLLGPNGSGKTTAINCILQLLTYDKGTIELFGKPMNVTSYDIKREIGVVPQNIAVFEELNVRENIDYFCGLYIKDAKRRKMLVDDAIEFVGLEEYVRARPRKLSGGLVRRLNIACGIAHRPKLAFFDEPTVAVDPQSRASILDGIKQMNADGTTVIYTSHYMEEVEEICDRIMIMDKGKTLGLGTNDELKAMAGAGEKIIIDIEGAPSGKPSGRLSGESSEPSGKSSSRPSASSGKSHALIEQLLALPHVIGAEIEGRVLTVTCENGDHNVADVLKVLSECSVLPGRIWAEPPTLNDVFLELTGRELRD